MVLAGDAAAAFAAAGRFWDSLPLTHVFAGHSLYCALPLPEFRDRWLFHYIVRAIASFSPLAATLMAALSSAPAVTASTEQLPHPPAPPFAVDISLGKWWWHYQRIAYHGMALRKALGSQHLIAVSSVTPPPVLSATMRPCACVQSPSHAKLSVFSSNIILGVWTVCW